MNDGPLERAIRDLDTERVVEIAEGRFGARGGIMSDDAVEFMAELLMRDDVASLPRAWNVVAVLDPEWPFLTPTQAGRLVAALRRFFHGCDDDMAAFMVGATMGEHASDRASLDVLADLAMSGANQGRRRGALYGLLAMAERNPGWRPIVRSVLTRLMAGGDASAAVEAAKWLAELDNM